MNAGQNRAKSIFLNAAEIASPTESQAYVVAECKGEDALFREVEDLLKHRGPAEAFLETPAPGVSTTIDWPLAEHLGTAIGPYKLLQQIGQGGMGTVFMAEQTAPVHRKVAIKVIKAGMDSQQVIARFEAERQALAMMDHVNIARVLDAGATESGRPYFVMELVHGVPITKYCDDNHLTPRQRLELFVPVCQAIQHAHQKGIIHRDIKPSNVMIALYDGKPVPKVIDFGVAKATEQKLTERTLFTQHGTLVGTLEYMSPEQAEMSDLGVDTRSDIYSLGVLLYELLTGSTPLSHKRIKEAAYAEILRMIKEEEPPKPSTRLNGTGDALASISAQRHMEPAKLTKLLRGELDWIVMKTLEKDRNRRYETANGLARDVERYLRDEPVQAYPPSAVYRFRKFTRRHKAGVAIAGLTLVILVVLGTGVGWMVRERAERFRAVEREVAEAQQWQKQEKWPEASSAMRRAEQLVADLGGNAKLQERVRDVRKDLDMVLRLEGIMNDLTGLQSDPLTFDFSRLDAEYAVAFKEYGIDVEVLGSEEAADLIGAKDIRLQLSVGLDAWAEARRFARRHRGNSWEGLLAIACAADPDPWRVRVRDALRKRNRAALVEAAGQIPIGSVPPITLGLLARALNDAGAPEQAEDLFRRAQRRHPNSFWLNFDLAISLLRQKPPRLDEGIRFLTVALALRPDNWPARSRLCDALLAQGKSDAALAEFREAIELNPNHAAAWINRGTAYHDLHQYDKAIADYSKVIELDPQNVLAWIRRGSSYHDIHQYDKALADYSRAIELDPQNVLAWTYRANSHHNLHQYDRAISDHSKAIELDPANSWSWSCRGFAYHSSRQYEKAIADYAKAIELDPNNRMGLNSLAWLLATCVDAKLRNPKRAVELAQRAVELAPKDGNLWNTLGVARYREGEWKASIAALEKSMELRRGGDSFDWFFLAMGHQHIGDEEQAGTWHEKACKWMDKNNPTDEELIGFRNEAATLLTMPKPPVGEVLPKKD